VDTTRSGTPDAGLAPADLQEYAVLGDGRSVALVGPTGSVDWWAAPQLDSPPVVSGIIAPDYLSRFALTPRAVRAIDRAYVKDTNVLVTTVTTGTGRVQITESLNSGVAGRLPWTELARRVDGLEGRVELDWTFVPGTGLREWSPWVESIGAEVVVHAGELTLGLVTSPGVSREVSHQQVTGSLAVSAGEREVLALVATLNEPVYIPRWQDVDDRIDRSTAAWRDWSGQIVVDGPHRDRVVRSALALKLLLMSATGAIAAAATTSLPERVGGDKNWDYRFAWIRDASLTVEALQRCGLQEEVHAAVSWLLAAIHRGGVQVLYTLSGDVPGAVREVPVGGYRNSRPVRVGNQARDQRQLGIHGDLFGTISAWVKAGHVLDVRTRRQLADLADRCADTWRLDDAGIWELETERQYTISKIGCWRALRCATELAEKGAIVGRGDRWAEEAELVRAWIEENCWSQARQSYTFYAGTEQLDASVLLGARFGFNTGERMSKTADAIIAELGAGDGLLFRYSGVQSEEECFLACSYWLVEALARLGRRAQADALMDELEQHASPLGLLSEMREPHGPLLGNLPQALSHLAHVNAATALLDLSAAGEPLG
jgi:GH15 family glucan-1,4-alpha-glucosidase